MEFVRWVNLRQRKQYKIICRPDPPDAILKYHDKFLWIEHADIYRSGDEAHEEYSFATPGEIPHRHTESPIFEPDKRTAIAVINILSQKLAKNSYAEIFNILGKGIILITERDPLFSQSTLETIKMEIKQYDFQNDLGYFEKIYLGIRSRDGLFFVNLKLRLNNMLPFNKKLKNLARALRSNMTDAERNLWAKIRGKQLKDKQFYRQKNIGNYIVDFYCPSVKLIVELDGGQHYSDEGKKKDEIRDSYLKHLGFRVLRFSARDVLKNTEGVLEKIFGHL